MKHTYPQRKSKYSDEYLEKIKNCISVREALSILGLNPDGGHKMLRRKIKKILQKNGNYKGQAYSKNTSFTRLPNDEFFSYRKIGTSKVRDALFARGLKEKKCEHCNNITWMGRPIPLEVHHIDGDKDNNRLENLEIVCPNCHAFTETYRGKNKKKKNGTVAEFGIGN